MDCRDVRDQLSDWVDGLLPLQQRAAVDTHLSSCAACAGVVRDLERIRDAARQLGPIDPPAHLWLEIAGQVQLERNPAAPSAVPAAPVRRHPAWQWIGL